MNEFQRVVDVHVSRSGGISLESLAADVTLGWLDDLRTALEGAKTSRHIEHVHRMRVACRRLRTALAAFDTIIARKSGRRWLQSIRRLGRSLGEVRDLDVQIDFLDAYERRQEDRADHPGIERLLLRLTQRRDRRQRHLRRSLDRFERESTVLDMLKAATGLKVKSRLRPSNSAGPVAAEAVLGRLEEWLAKENCLTDPHDVEAHHDFRIAAKRLRYAVELFQPVFGVEVEEMLERTRKVQKILGDLHDCDVWIEFLPRFIEKERIRTVKFFGHAKGFKRIARGLENLQAQRRRARHDIYLTLLEYWGQCRRDRTWDRLRELVHSLEADSRPTEPPVILTEMNALQRSEGRLGEGSH